MFGQRTQMRFGGPITPVVKKLMIINGAVFIFQLFFAIFSGSSGKAVSGFDQFFGLSHQGLIISLKLWQVFTYMFLHGGWMHIIFNLVALWMFAGELEQQWGSKAFLRFYLYSGIGAGLFIALLNIYIFSNYNVSPITLGASGAIYGVLLAYGMTWPNREVLLWFILPIKMKYLVLFFGLFEFFGTLSSATAGNGGISHIGHLGGLISGFIIIYSRRKGLGSKKTVNQSAGFVKKRRLKKQQQLIQDRIKAKKIIDELLEKITKTGMNSLTADEKKQLEWARKNYYPEDRQTYH